MTVPNACPYNSIMVDELKEQMLQKPNVARNIWIEPVVELQESEELLPFLTKVMGDIIP